ncbi:MAG: carbohydrate ABC transporter permease, partial [Acetobacteraceae bacterium]|nr:carbohydrate ABC transporter permease [Acetobacteraceae bacterium]
MPARRAIPELRRPARFVYAFYLPLALVVLAPFAWAFFGAFKGGSELFLYPPTLWPRQPTLQNFADVFVRLNFGSYLVNTVIVAACTIALTLFFGALGAYAV